MMKALLFLLVLLDSTHGDSVVVPSPDGSGYSYRVQALSHSLVRVERSRQAGAAPQFEDQPTFLAAKNLTSLRFSLSFLTQLCS